MDSDFQTRVNLWCRVAEKSKRAVEQQENSGENLTLT